MGGSAAQCGWNAFAARPWGRHFAYGNELNFVLDCARSPTYNEYLRATRHSPPGTSRSSYPSRMLSPLASPLYPQDDFRIAAKNGAAVFFSRNWVARILVRTVERMA